MAMPIPPTASTRFELPDVDGDMMIVEPVNGLDTIGIKFGGTYREFPKGQAPKIALAILTAAGLIKPAGVVAEDETLGYRRQTIDGEQFSANSDPQFWVETVEYAKTVLIRDLQYLVQRIAIRDYFADETARAAETAERADRVRLESEAYALYRVSCIATGLTPAPDWATAISLNNTTERDFIAIAQAAREIHGASK